MSAVSVEVEVTLFGREFTITADQIRQTETTLTLIGCHESVTESQRDTLREALRIVRDLSTPPAEQAS